MNPYISRSDFTWKEYGVLFYLIEKYNVGLFVETGVGCGDVASFMISKCLYKEDFQYLGITNDISAVDNGIEKVLNLTPNAYIISASCFSNSITKRIGKLIYNSPRAALVFCDGIDIDKEFNRYFELLRPGDVIVCGGFPLKFYLSTFKKKEDVEKLSRITGNFIFGTTLISGKVL